MKFFRVKNFFQRFFYLGEPKIAFGEFERSRRNINIEIEARITRKRRTNFQFST